MRQFGNGMKQAGRHFADPLSAQKCSRYLKIYAHVQGIIKYLAQRNENIADASCTGVETFRQIQMIQIQSS